MAMNIKIGDVWSARPNRDSDSVIFEIVGHVLVDGKDNWWIGVKHFSNGRDLLERFEVNATVFDAAGLSIPSNLTLAPLLQWKLEKKLRVKPIYSHKKE